MELWGSHQFDVFGYESKENYSKTSLLGGLYSSENMLLSADYTYTGDVNVMEWGKYLIDDNENMYTLMAHGNMDGIYLTLYQSGFLDGVDLANKLKSDKIFNYNDEGTIKLYSCNTGVGSINVAQVLANEMDKTVIAPTNYLEVKLKSFAFKKWTSTKIKDDGYWKVFRPQ